MPGCVYGELLALEVSNVCPDHPLYTFHRGDQRQYAPVGRSPVQRSPDIAGAAPDLLLMLPHFVGPEAALGNQYAAKLIM